LPRTSILPAVFELKTSPSFGDWMRTSGGILSRMIWSSKEAAFPISSMTSTTILFWVALRSASPSNSPPKFSTVTPFTLTVALGSVIPVIVTLLRFVSM